MPPTLTWPDAADLTPLESMARFRRTPGRVQGWVSHGPIPRRLVPHAQSKQTEYLHLTLKATPEHLRTLRHEVMRCLASLPMPQDRREEVVVAVGEAASNSVQHAYSPDEAGIVELFFWTEPDALCV